MHADIRTAWPGSSPTDLSELPARSLRAEIRVSSGSFPILRKPSTCLAETVDLDASAAQPAGDVSAQLPRKPVLTYWLIAIALEVVLGAAFFATGADAAIERGLTRAGLDFGSDLVTAARVVIVFARGPRRWVLGAAFRPG